MGGYSGMALSDVSAKIEKITSSAYRIPTDRPESDGTFQWDSTTIVIAHCHGGGYRGLGYTYSSAGAVNVIHDQLSHAVEGLNVFDTGACWRALIAAIRNLGNSGVARMAAAAVIASIWDLKARLLDIPLVTLLGAFQPGIPVYGSGGFTTYSLDEITWQLGGWADEGFSMVKMKIGRDLLLDHERIRVAREAIGPGVQLFVDANEAYDRKEALAVTDLLVRYGVTWYEQPVNHFDLEGMRLIRDRAPATLEIASGEYAFDLEFFRRIMEAGAVDVVQADATRCGLNTFMDAASLCLGHYLPLSAHTAPALHLPLCCAAPQARHLEYFHDHVRIENMIFEGVQKPRAGILYPDLERPGFGLELKEKDAQRYAL